ncbi:MAG: hypothetical protein LBH04_07465 [Tannerellaceae bacterium]|jgi:hypothetical protein|nr:hypothetical protein [Tannerellaceae bacterium]
MKLAVGPIPNSFSVSIKCFTAIILSWQISLSLVPPLGFLFKDARALSVMSASVRGQGLKPAPATPAPAKDAHAGKILSIEEFQSRRVADYARENNVDFGAEENRELYDDILTQAKADYPLYIKELQGSGELQRMYDRANPKEQKKIRGATEEGGLDVKDVLNTSAKQVRFQTDEALERVNDRFNEELEGLTAEKAGAKDYTVQLE